MIIWKSIKGFKNLYLISTNIDVLEIIKLYKSNVFTQKELGELYNINQTIISRIVNRKIWKHINGE